jgi:shikimate kinase
MKNIYLVGFMGTGKTTIAKILANKLSKKFVEMDRVIEQEEGKKVKDIFAEYGETYFRKLEKQLLDKLSSQTDLVVSCGGGLVCSEKNLKILKESGYLFSLYACPSSIFERVKNSNQRPLLNVENPLEKIGQLLRARNPYYEKAGLRVNTDKLSAQEAADYIVNLLENG